MTVIHVVGAGEHARVVYDVIQRLTPEQPVVWHDDAWESIQPVGPVADVRSVADLLDDQQNHNVVVAIGGVRARLMLMEKVESSGHELLTLVHPFSSMSPWVSLGVGTVLMAGCVVQSGAQIDRGCIINTSASVDHDCRLQAGVHVAPGATLGGCVSVGERSWIGAGAVVREGISIGKNVLVGAGAVVVKDIGDDVVVAGNPARFLRDSLVTES